MIPLSSIFSFKTLQGSFRPGKALWLALVLVFGLEVALHIIPLRMVWEEGSWEMWAVHIRHRVQKEHPELVFVGNSLLGSGVDVDVFERDAGLSALSIPFGSATVSGQLAILQHVLHGLPTPPKYVVIAVSKDDFNKNGERMLVSRKYEAYTTWKRFHPKHFLRLLHPFVSKNTIFSILFNRPVVSRKYNFRSTPFDGVVTPRWKDRIEQLMQDYELDRDVLERFSEYANQNRFKVAVVILPVPQMYIAAHDEKYPDLQYKQIMEELGLLCLELGIPFWDASILAPDVSLYYHDPVHMTTMGRDWFTPQLAAFIRSEMKK